MNIAQHLRILLHSAGILQKDLAAALDVSDAYVSDMLRGNRNITPKFLKAFCDVLPVNKMARLDLNKQAAREAGWEI